MKTNNLNKSGGKMETKYEDVPENFWEPKEVEDSVSGILIKIQREVGPNKSSLYSLEGKDGAVNLVWGSTVLDNKMAAVVVGNDIKIIYLGVKSGKQDYKDYKVQRAVVEQESQEE